MLAERERLWRQGSWECTERARAWASAPASGTSKKGGPDLSPFLAQPLWHTLVSPSATVWLYGEPGRFAELKISSPGTDLCTDEAHRYILREPGNSRARAGSSHRSERRRQPG